MAFKRMIAAQRKWRKLDGRNWPAETIEEIRFRDKLCPLERRLIRQRVLLALSWGQNQGRRVGPYGEISPIPPVAVKRLCSAPADGFRIDWLDGTAVSCEIQRFVQPSKTGMTIS